jgi:hypothetical protein
MQHRNALLSFVAATLLVRSPDVAVAQPAVARFEGWNIAYAVPAGWRITQQQGRVHTLSPGTNDMVLYVVPGLYATFDDVAAELPKAFQLLGITGMPTSQPQSSTVNGMRAMSADYMGQDRMGSPIQSRVMAVLTPHGSGLVVLGFARAGSATQLPSAIDQTIQRIEAAAAPVVNAQAVQALRGKWNLYSGRAEGVTGTLGGSSRSFEENVEFDGAGRFAWSSSASVSVTAPGSAGSASGGNASSDQGSYTVIGTTLVVRGRQGMASYEVQILGDRFVADGRTYFRGG